MAMAAIEPRETDGHECQGEQARQPVEQHAPIDSMPYVRISLVRHAAKRMVEAQRGKAGSRGHG
jgi:hypothetical protein